MRESVERFADGPRGAWLALLWGFAEATLFFLVPDVVLTWLALRGTRVALRGVALALVGALLGGALVVGLAARHPERAREALTRVPGIDAALVREVGDAVERDGPRAIVAGGFTGRPYKIYAVEWGATGRAWAPFLLASLSGRLGRFLAAVLVTRLLAARLPGSVARILWALFWVAFYAWYLGVYRAG